MRKAVSLLISLILLLVLINAPVTNLAAPVATTASVLATTNVEERVFQAINQVRIAHGLPALSLKNDLSFVARAHSQDMATRAYFSHVSPEGKGLQDRISQGGITNWSRLAENLAANQGHADPAETAVQGWMNSDGHRHNILDKNLAETGIGVALDSAGKIFVTQLFAKRNI